VLGAGIYNAALSIMREMVGRNFPIVRDNFAACFYKAVAKRTLCVYAQSPKEYTRKSQGLNSYV